MAEPDFNLLIALDALLAEGSVAGASRRLGLSSSAMSRTLTRLRDVTQDALLVRAGRQMVLTPHAEALRDRTRAAVHDARGVLAPPDSRFDIASLERTFTIRANDGFIEVLAATLIAEAANVAPGVRLCFASKAEKTSVPLREGLVDLEVGVQARMGPEVRIQALFRDRFVGVIAKDHPLSSMAAVSPDDYIAFGHVVASRRGLTAGPVDDALAVLGLERKVVAVVPSFQAVLAVVQASRLIGLVPASYMSRRRDARVFDLPVQVPGITVSQMWHPRLDGDAAHRWLRQMMLAVSRAMIPV